MTPADMLMAVGLLAGGLAVLGLNVGLLVVYLQGREKR